MRSLRWIINHVLAAGDPRLPALVISIAVLLAGCQAKTDVPQPGAPTPTPPSSQTPPPSITEAPLSPSPTAYSEEEIEMIRQAYRGMLFVQIENVLIREVVRGLQSGVYPAQEAYNAVLALSSLIAAVDESLTSSDPPEAFRAYWNEMLEVHANTQSSYNGWFIQDLNGQELLETVEDNILQAEGVLNEAEEQLSSVYDFDAQEITRMRQLYLSELRSAFSAPAP